MENQIESVLEHIKGETGFDYIESSLKTEAGILQKAHHAIHECAYLATLCFPNDESEVIWKNKSAFLVYHWEILQHAHRSSLEALCTYYNVAFVLLRTTLELLLWGAFWQCLTQKQFQDSLFVSSEFTKDKKIKEFKAALNASPGFEGEYERVSAEIFDLVGDKIKNRSFRLPVNILVKQLAQWGIFSPMKNAFVLVYQELYSSLSADVHVIPDRTDIGRKVISGSSDLFERKIVPTALSEYAMTLHKIMDIAMLVELNIFQDLIEQFETVRSKLSGTIPVLEKLELEYGLMKMHQLLTLPT